MFVLILRKRIQECQDTDCSVRPSDERIGDDRQGEVTGEDVGLHGGGVIGGDFTQDGVVAGELAVGGAVDMAAETEQEKGFLTKGSLILGQPLTIRYTWSGLIERLTKNAEAVCTREKAKKKKKYY
jgi:hypothetical protein